MMRQVWACIAAVTIGVWAAAVPASAQSAAAPPERILVMPFENPGREARVYWLGEAAALLLTGELNARGKRAYTREDRLAAFEELQVPPAATLSRATVIRLGQAVGATHVVIGSFRLTSGQLAVRVQSIRLDSGRMEHELAETGALENLFAIFERLSVRLGGSAEVKAEGRPALPVFENFVKGLIATSTRARITYLEAAIKQDPAYDRARLALWAVHHDEGDGQAALLAAAGVPETSPDYERARFSMALSLIQLKRFDAAFAALRAMADRAPSAPVMNNLGVIQLQRTPTPETGRATYYFNQALKLDEDDPDYYFNVGYAYWAEKDAQSTIFWLREAVRRNPTDGEAHAVLAAALQASGATAEAARERELATQLSSRFAEWARKPAGTEPVPRGLERLKRSPEVSRLVRIETAIAVTGQREQKELAAFHLNRGRRLYEQGVNDEAIKELRRALYLSPYEAAAHLLLGRVYLRAGQPVAAIDAFKVALWSEESAEGRIALARAYLQAKNEAAAREALQRALALDPASSEARDLLATMTP